MIASKDWGPCNCNCGKNICKGDEFVIVEGSMYLLGHEERRTRQIPAFKTQESTPKGKTKKAPKGISDLPLFADSKE
jgi:hypothetical protein